jgi:drug/metabolite transporter (DMT)-like permease
MPKNLIGYTLGLICFAAWFASFFVPKEIKSPLVATWSISFGIFLIISSLYSGNNDKMFSYIKKRAKSKKEIIVIRFIGAFITMLGLGTVLDYLRWGV